MSYGWSMDLSNIKVVFTDLDGTLLNNQEQLSCKTVEALTKAKQAGLHVVPVTGRNPSFVIDRFKNIPIAELAGASNGAVMIDMITGKAVQLHTFTNSHRDRVITKLSKAFASSWIGYQRLDELMLSREFLDYLGWNLHGVVDLDQPDDCYKILMHQPGIDQSEIQEELSKLLPECSVVLCQPASNQTKWFDILADHSDKGTIAESIALRLGIDIKDTLSVGDEDNDLSLFSKTGVSVATGNAHDSIKAAADFVCGRNDEDGVADLINQILG